MPFLYGTKYKHVLSQSFISYSNISNLLLFLAYTFLALETKISKRTNFYIQNTNNTWKNTFIVLQMPRK